MNITRHPFATVLLTAPLWLAIPANANDAADATPEDPVAAAIRAFNQRSHPEGAGEESPTASDQPERGLPVLVTGKRPPGGDVIDISEIPVASDEQALKAVMQTEPTPKPGLEVRVAKIKTGEGEIDTAKVHLLTPFPAKPLIPPPAGWRLEPSKEAPPFKRDVELAAGSRITLTIHPHVLVPDADGAVQFAIQEPGFDASLGYRQSDTVAGVLSQSIEQLDKDSKHLGTIIDSLQQLIVSLPKPSPPTPQEAPATR